MSDSTKTLLVIGEYATGKTHYGGQILGRLNRGEGILKMRQAPENIEPFEEVLNCLGQGITAGHTPTNVYKEIKLPVQLPTGQSVDLVWPDYGGEQIKQMVEYRQVSQKWRKRLMDSDGWLLFLRLEQIREYEDILSRPREISASTDESHVENSDFTWSTSAFYVELIQMLLYSKGLGTLKKINTPSLVILLSCWDKISIQNETMKPCELLLQQMPFFLDYIESTWKPDFFSIFGLSSLGRDLSQDTPDEDYVDQGPENQGYVILPDGKKSSDLTLSISVLME